jgi:2-succinyl-6-hydroxy-2,4-cyclohexadiene-1-carboxylate synthase
MPLLKSEQQGSGPKLVWLHGFTQTRQSAHLFRSILAGTHQVDAFDLPGHGESSEVDASLEETADFISSCLSDEPVVLGGYSLGARVALHVALRHPEQVKALILLGASRGIEDVALRAERMSRDEKLAERIEIIGTDTFLDEWLAQPMFSSLPDDPLERAARSRDPGGLARSLRRSGTGTQTFLGPHLASLTMPVLCMAGVLDAKFVAEAHAIAAGVTHGVARTIPGAQHAAHLEQPGACAEVIEEFLVA